MGRLFGTDGVRGVANTELTVELALSLGRAVVLTLREEGRGRTSAGGRRRPHLVIGRDPRASGEMLEAALVAGITSAGGDVTTVGCLPTPGVAYLTVALEADSGAMISASHNPVADNGIKFFGPDGYKLTDAEEERVAALVDGGDPDRPTGIHIGRSASGSHLLERYADHLVAAADADLGRLRVVVDCANGAASSVAPEVLRRLGCDLTVINAAPDGTNINERCGSNHPDAVAAAVIEHGADVGLAHDGDADRLVAVDHRGEVVDGDAILAILARELHAEHGLNAVVTTVMTNLGFVQAMHELGIEVVQTQVGDRYVLEAMRQGGHPLGGEQSGHLIFADVATTGDGVLSAVRLLSTLARSGRSLAELATVMCRLPQVLVNVADIDRTRLAGADALWKSVAKEEKALGGNGRVLVRASGTEPLVRIMVEADNEPHAREVAQRLATVATEELGSR
ncbi:MAG: phosphoglucosamine mutase [Actinomycetota bacterium]|jgi:phosphoglucosamine mutase|nr:phosphoglucosamine mutase [Actinomycetota bacterium]